MFNVSEFFPLEKIKYQSKRKVKAYPYVSFAHSSAYSYESFREF